ncbi:MAG: hypothetical protein LBC86_03445, partial [Oscillospiraceae bacterium]|nr:hypothetical protein [Oscillospiraceae bacterium]
MKLKKLLAVAVAAIMMTTAIPAAVPAGAAVLNPNVPEDAPYNAGKYLFNVMDDLNGEIFDVAGIRIFIGPPDGRGAVWEGFNGALEVMSGETNFRQMNFGGVAADIDDWVIVSDGRTIEWHDDEPVFSPEDNSWAQFTLDGYGGDFYVRRWEYLDKDGDVISGKFPNRGIINSNITDPADDAFGSFRFDARADLGDDFTRVTGIEISITHPDGWWEIDDYVVGVIQYSNQQTGGTNWGATFGTQTRQDDPYEGNIDVVTDKQTIMWNSHEPLFASDDDRAEILLTCWWPFDAFRVVSWSYLDENGSYIGEWSNDTFFSNGIINSNHYNYEWDMAKYEFNAANDLSDNDFEKVAGIRVNIGHPKGNWELRNGYIGAFEFVSEDVYGRSAPFDGQGYDPVNPNNYSGRFFVQWVEDAPLFAGSNTGSILIEVWWPAFSVTSWTYLDSDGNDIGGEFFAGRRIPITPFAGTFVFQVVAEGPGPDKWEWRTTHRDDNLTGGGNFYNNIQLDRNLWDENGATTTGNWTGNETSVSLGVTPFGRIKPAIGDYIDFTYTLTITPHDGAQPVEIASPSSFRAVHGDDRNTLHIQLIDYVKEYLDFSGWDYNLGQVNFRIDAINGKDVFHTHNMPDIELAKWDGINEEENQVFWVSDGIDGISNGIHSNNFTRAKGIEIQTEGLTLDLYTDIVLVWQFEQDGHGAGWNQSKNIRLDNVLDGDVIRIDFRQHISDYENFLIAGGIKLWICQWSGGGIEALGITGASLYFCDCETQDGRTINLTDSAVINPDSQKMVSWGTNGVDGIFNGLSAEAFTSAKGLAVEFANPDLFSPGAEIQFVWQAAGDWTWNNVAVPVRSVLCDDGVFRFDFRDFMFMHQHFLWRNSDIKLILGYWGGANFEELEIVNAYLYGLGATQGGGNDNGGGAGRFYDYRFDLGTTPTDFGGASDNQWLWASNGADGLRNGEDGIEGRLDSWRFKAATGVAFRFDKAPNLNSTMHLIWQGDFSDWRWHQFDVPVSEVYNHAENTVFIEFERYINNFTGFSNSDYLKLGIAYWENGGLVELGITDAFLYGSNTIYREYSKNIFFGKGHFSGSQLFEGNYQPYDIDFSEVAAVEFTFHIANYEEMLAAEAE